MPTRAQALNFHAPGHPETKLSLLLVTQTLGTETINSAIMSFENKKIKFHFSYIYWPVASGSVPFEDLVVVVRAWHSFNSKIFVVRTWPNFDSRIFWLFGRGTVLN